MIFIIKTQYNRTSESDIHHPRHGQLFSHRSKDHIVQHPRLYYLKIVVVVLPSCYPAIDFRSIQYANYLKHLGTKLKYAYYLSNNKNEPDHT